MEDLEPVVEADPVCNAEHGAAFNQARKGKAMADDRTVDHRDTLADSDALQGVPLILKVNVRRARSQLLEVKTAFDPQMKLSPIMVRLPGRREAAGRQSAWATLWFCQSACAGWRAPIRIWSRIAAAKARAILRLPWGLR